MNDFSKALKMYLKYRHIKDTYVSLVSDMNYPDLYAEVGVSTPAANIRV